MKKLNPKISIDLSVEEINEINELRERDTAKALVRKSYKFKDKDEYYEACPICGSIVSGTKKFCTECGQRLDAENIAL